MARTSPSRLALQELPVNTAITAYAQGPLSKTATVPKRPISEVDSPNSTPPKSRLCTGKDVSIASPAKHLPLPLDGTDTQDNEHNSSQTSSASSTPSHADFDNTQISQGTAFTEPSQLAPYILTTPAETLRLRLSVAMFKIRTGQTHLPMAQLQINSPSASANAYAPSDSTSPVRAVPTLLPAPVLEPTAFSARNISRSPTLSSSPPKSPDGRKEEGFRTPALPKEARSGEGELGSPPSSRRADGEVAREKIMTSSAVKGSVARSLLGLSQGIS